MKNLSKQKTWIAAIVVSGLVVTGCSITAGPGAMDMSHEETSNIATALANEITVFRSPTCGCCGLWIEHMQAAGFEVKDEITEDMSAIKQQYGVPSNLASCHTTVVTTGEQQYIVEGHIPADDVLQLLTEQPDITGIAVPGMPIGSPGMESGNYVEPYTVFSFTEDGGKTTPFSEHS